MNGLSASLWYGEKCRFTTHNEYLLIQLYGVCKLCMYAIYREQKNHPYLCWYFEKGWFSFSKIHSTKAIESQKKRENLMNTVSYTDNRVRNLNKKLNPDVH
jgi:hypothetical protein